MKRSYYISAIVALLVTVPLFLYQNFLGAPPPQLASLKSDRFTVLGPMENQVVSMTDDRLLVWVEAESEMAANLQIVGEGGEIQYRQTVHLNSGENEFNLTPSKDFKSAQPAWMYVEILADNTTIVRQRFGWGLLFLTAGGSNTANYHCEDCPSQAALSDVLFLNFINDEFVFETATTKSPLADGEKQSPWLYLGEKIWSANRIPVAFINVGSHPAGIQYWLTKNFERFNFGKHFQISAVLWDHEEPSNSTPPRENYRAMLFDLIEFSRKVMEYEAPWFVTRSPGCEADNQEVVAAQNDIISQMGLPLIFQGPSLNNHSCLFKSVQEVETYVDSWYFALKNSLVFQKILK